MLKLFGLLPPSLLKLLLNGSFGDRPKEKRELTASDADPAAAPSALAGGIVVPPLRCSATMEHLLGLGACLVAAEGPPPAPPAAARSRPGEISSGALDVLRCSLLDSPSAGAGAPDSVAEFDGSVAPMRPPPSCAAPSPFGLCSSLSQKGMLFAVSLLPPAGVPP